jgi:hypothetical protein
MHMNVCTQGNLRLPALTVVTEYSYLGGDRAVFDNNFNYVDATTGIFNQKRDWDGQAQLNAKWNNVPLCGLTYWYANDATNYGKKVKFLDIYYHDGTKWVLHLTLTSDTPYSGGPATQVFDFRENPMPNPTGKVRVVGRGTWDINSYRWVAECRFSVFV